MYLVKHGQSKALKLLTKYNFDVNFRNKKGETLVSILINQFYNIYQNGDLNSLYKYGETLMTLIDIGCDFNAPIDEDGNTPIMFFMMMNDYYSTFYILDYYKLLNLSIKNKYEENATYYSILMENNSKTLTKALINHKSYDFFFQETKQDNNILMYYALINDYDSALTTITKYPQLINHTNQKGENFLIISVKLGHNDFLRYKFLSNININQQDHLGNTALHYAITLRNKYAINALCYNKAKTNIKNNEGLTAIELIHKLEEPGLLKIINDPIIPQKMEKKLKSKPYDTKHLFSKITKKKATDEKVDNYVMNYIIKNNKKEYSYLLKSPNQKYFSTKYVKSGEDILNSTYYGEDDDNTAIALALGVSSLL